MTARQAIGRRLNRLSFRMELASWRIAATASRLQAPPPGWYTCSGTCDYEWEHLGGDRWSGPHTPDGRTRAHTISGPQLREQYGDCAASLRPLPTPTRGETT